MENHDLYPPTKRGGVNEPPEGGRPSPPPPPPWTDRSDRTARDLIQLMDDLLGRVEKMPGAPSGVTEARIKAYRFLNNKL